ncbi:hypothetical protein ACQY0O_003640 [Thecaphora frezii]
MSDAATTSTPPPDAKYPLSWSTAGSSSRNSGPIASALLPLLPSSSHPRPLILELSSGFGHQLSLLSSQAPHVHFQPTEADEYLCSQIDATCASQPNVRRAKLLDLASQQHWLGIAHALALENVADDGLIDGVVVCNLTHVAPWSVTRSVFAHLDPRMAFGTQKGQRSILKPSGWVAIYGALNEQGQFTSEGNRKFDAEIRNRNPEFGLRDLDSQLVPLANQHGFQLKQKIQMPAGNLLVVFEVRQ